MALGLVSSRSWKGLEETAGEGEKYSKNIVLESWRKEEPSYVLVEDSETIAFRGLEEKVVDELMDLVKAISKNNVDSYSYYWSKQV